MRRRWSRSSKRYLTSSVVLALLAGISIHSYLGRLASSAAAAGPQVPMVVAATPIPRGARLASGQLRVSSIPKAYAPPGSFTRISQASGRVALADLAAGEAVTETRLARVRAGPVASLIPEGLRAFAVPTTLPRGAVQPGDRVDVLATFNAGTPHTEQVVTEVEVLLVLGQVGAHTPGTQDTGLDGLADGGGGQTTLLLLVGPDQEERLAFARAFASLEVAIAPMETRP